MLDLDAYFAATHRRLHFGNPVSADVLDRVLALADLEPGSRCADLGAGNAAMACHLAERYGLVVDAVERSPGMVALARHRLADHPAAERVTLHEASAEAFLSERSGYALIVVMGAAGVAPGASGLADTLAWLHGRLRPRGLVLFGDPFLRPSASAGLRAAMPAATGFADNIRAAEAAGMTTVYATESSQQDWDDYAWRLAAGLEAHARDTPADPHLSSIAAQVGRMRELYLADGRDAVGFGMYLLRK
jgi:SAM-dependent methyltransferase